MIPACLTEVCRELKAKCIMPSCSETPRGVRPSKPTLIHLGEVLRTIYTAAGSPAPVLSPPPESELKGHKREKKKKVLHTEIQEMSFHTRQTLEAAEYEAEYSQGM